VDLDCSAADAVTVLALLRVLLLWQVVLDEDSAVATAVLLLLAADLSGGEDLCRI
jgi:hypothetical protein